MTRAILLVALLAAAGCGRDDTSHAFACDCVVTCQRNLDCASAFASMCSLEAQPGGWIEQCSGQTVTIESGSTSGAKIEMSAACLASAPNIDTCACDCLPL